MESINNNLNLQIGLGQLNSSVRKAADKALEGELAENGAAGNILQSFGEMLNTQMREISHLQATADEAVQTYAVGGDIELHNVILASEKAGLAMELAVQVRNRIIAAYQEINRMTI